MFLLILKIYLIFLAHTDIVLSDTVQPYFSKIHGGYYKGGIDNNIIDDISNAKSDIKMAMYYLTNKNITKALLNAKSRGINIEILTDDSKIKSKRYKSLINHGISIRDDEDKKALMHNKILIIDNNLTWISSGNYTVYAFYRNYDNYVRINDDEIGDYYSKKFKNLYEHNQSKLKPYINNNLEIYFSKDTNIENIIIQNIDKAKKSLYVMMFAFTNKNIATALIKAKNRGVEVKVILDKVQHRFQRKYSVYKYLKDNNIDIKFDKNRFKLHNKVLIIDNKIVITGSYNYTKRANIYNDENILIIKDKNITQQYISDFNRVNK